MPRKYKKLEKQLRLVAPHSFAHLFIRFGFTNRHITFFWQSEVVRMAYRNFLNGYIDIDYFYMIVYQWIEEYKFEYGKKAYKLYVYQAVRDTLGPYTTTKKMARTAFLYSKRNLV